ncbi:MAG: hypothetical protein M1838_001477 [Thelocarpon superellum]|nr:MAG: hypothetical protein M1838_001477 [Thelocarpon superellum]
MSPPASEELSVVLDGLLERFLNLLDDYQLLRQQMSKGLSSGYLSIAQANFAAPSRVRYGQDHYDNRMQALRRVSFLPKPSSTTSAPIVSITTAPQPVQSEPHNPAGADDRRAVADETQESKAEEKGKDPLRWFGILVPPALRAAQQDFTTVLVEAVPRLVQAEREMHVVEEEILEVRRQMELR